MIDQNGQDDGADWFGQNAPPNTGGLSFGNPVYDQIAQLYRSAGHEPTQEDVSRWGTNVDARYLAAIGQKIREQFGAGGPQSGPNGTTPPPPAATPTPTPGSGGPNAFRDAWLASGGKNVTDLAAFAKAHPELGGTVTGSKGSKVQFANGQTFQAVRSAGLDGGIAGVWDDLSQEGAAPPAQGGYTAPAGSALPDFVAPTGLSEQNDPGFKERMAVGEQGVQRGLAAQGIAHTGGALKDLMQYDQTFASNEFGNVWNRELQNYGTKYGKATDTYNRAKGEYDTKFGNLFSLSQLDSQNQNQLNNLNLGYAGLFGNISGNGANAYGNYLGQGANARAAGTVGQSNAWNSLFSSIPRSALDAYYASQYGRAPSGAGGSGNALPGTY